MCGIAGFLQAGAVVEAPAAVARAMADALRHRGPDDSGVWTDDAAGIALGHRRLSIVDLSASGHQPMVSASGRYVISYNGEVYNFPDIRRDLEAGGVRFRGDSDTEVMLAAIDAYGLGAAVDRFIGMFAFALWDRDTRELTLVRDRLGIKPLYWGRIGGLFLFGSELNALRACPGWTPAIDIDSLAAYARWNYVPTPYCIYRGIRKLAPGSLLRVRAGAPPAIETYWDLRRIAGDGVANRSDLSRPAAADALEALLADSVRRRMIADVPIGAFLSGGIDSSAVVALMQRESDRPVKTYTIGFQEADYDEARHARSVAAHLGTDHTELRVDPATALAAIPDLPRHYDEPFGDSSQLPTLLVSRLTRHHVTVALSGDGGDELFAGYTRYRWADMVRRRFGWLPPACRRAAAGLVTAVPDPVWRGLSPAAVSPGGTSRLADRARRLAALLRAGDADGLYRRQHSQWDDPTALVPGGVEPAVGAFAADGRSEIPNFIERMQLFDSLTYLHDDILTKVDRASMAVNLEVRVPLLDHRLVEFAWRLPFDMRLGQDGGKRLLRDVLHRHVPQALVSRPKMGFGVPIGRWLRGPARDWAEALLDESRLRQEALFDPAPIQRMWDDIVAGRTEIQEPIWGILMFQAWHEMYAGGGRSAGASTHDAPRQSQAG